MRICGKPGAAGRRGLPLGAGRPRAHSIPAPQPQPVAGSPLLSTISLCKNVFVGFTQPSGLCMQLNVEEQVASAPGCLGLGQTQGKQSWDKAILGQAGGACSQVCHGCSRLTSVLR